MSEKRHIEIRLTGNSVTRKRTIDIDRDTGVATYKSSCVNNNGDNEVV